MAYLQENLLDEEENKGPLQAQGQDGGAAPLVGSGSNAAGTGVGQVQGGSQGAGGTGFTNIQEYLNANKGDTGSAGALQNTVGGQFGQERANFESDSSKYLDDAQKQANEKKVSTDQAESYLKDAGASYSWDGNQDNQQYQGIVNKMKSALKDPYSGPTNYTYGFNAKTQEYGDAVKNDSAFDSLMNTVYSKNANGPLTSGQFELQKQLDTSNVNLRNTRDQLGGAYEQLGKDRDKTITDTTSKLGGIADDYRNAQVKLNDFVTNKQSSLDSDIANQEYAARNNYSNDYKRGSSTVPIYNQALLAGVDPMSSGAVRFTYQDNGNAGQNWEDVQNMLNRQSNFNFFDRDDYLGSPQNPRLATNDAAWRNTAGTGIQGFYQQSDEKYGNTADEQERAYNALLDFLGSNGERKIKGFNYKG